jgi:hypothetical protein
MTKYIVGVQYFPERKDRQMAMVLSAWKPTQRECFGEIPDLKLSARPGSVTAIADLVVKAMRLPGLSCTASSFQTPCSNISRQINCMDYYRIGCKPIMSGLFL